MRTPKSPRVVIYGSPALITYDFGARWYSPRSARWATQDPFAEKYYSISPYAYCAGNPINLLDPTRENMDEYYSILNGKYLGSDMYGKASRLISEDDYNSITGGKPYFNKLGYDALSIWGKSDKPKY